MAWMIDRDYLDSGEDSAVGTAQGELTGATYRFRLLDDDDIVYYGGKADDAAADLDAEHGGLYMAEQWGAFYAGAIHLELHCADAIRLGLWSQEYADKYGQTDASWIRVYG
jgi:hypothetical protein